MRNTGPGPHSVQDSAAQDSAAKELRRQLHLQISEDAFFVRILEQRCRSRVVGYGKWLRSSTHRHWPRDRARYLAPWGLVLKKQDPHSLDTCDEVLATQGKDTEEEEPGSCHPRLPGQGWGAKLLLKGVCGVGCHSTPCPHFPSEEHRGQRKGPELQTTRTKSVQFLKKPITPYTPDFFVYTKYK